MKQFLALIVDAIALARNLHLLNVGSTPSRVRVSVDAPDDLLRILTEQ